MGEAPRRALAGPAQLHDLGAEALHQPLAEAQRAREEPRARAVRLEIAEHRRGRLVADLTIDLQRARHDSLELLLFWEAARRERLDLRAARHVDEPLARRGAVEAAPREQLPQDDAGREDVRAVIDVLAARVLRAHVAGLSADGLVVEIARRVGARDAEIADLHLALEADEDVRRGDVAVNELAAVRVVEAAQRLHHHQERELDGQRDAKVRAPAAELAEIEALHVLHRDEKAARVAPEILDGDDVGVREARCELRLVDEHRREHGVVGVLREDLLDDDAAAPAEIGLDARQVDVRHAPATHVIEEQVTAEARRERTRPEGRRPGEGPRREQGGGGRCEHAPAMPPPRPRGQVTRASNTERIEPVRGCPRRPRRRRSCRGSRAGAMLGA